MQLKCKKKHNFAKSFCRNKNTEESGPQSFSVESDVLDIKTITEISRKSYIISSVF